MQGWMVRQFSVFYKIDCLDDESVCQSVGNVILLGNMGKKSAKASTDAPFARAAIVGFSVLR
jgi:hypothetical protein